MKHKGSQVPWDRVRRIRREASAAIEAAELLRMRTRLRLTQLDISAMLRVSPATYYRWESGRGRVPFCALALLRYWSREGPVSRARSRSRSTDAA